MVLIGLRKGSEYQQIWKKINPIHIIVVRVDGGNFCLVMAHRAGPTGLCEVYWLVCANNRCKDFESQELKWVHQPTAQPVLLRAR